MIKVVVVDDHPVVRDGLRALFAEYPEIELIGEAFEEVIKNRRYTCYACAIMPDHIHLCLSIPPKYSVAHAVGFLKGKSAVRIHRELLHERRMSGLHFWAAGYCVSTVGLDEARVRQYIREQEELENRQGELGFE